MDSDAWKTVRFVVLGFCGGVVSVLLASLMFKLLPLPNPIGLLLFLAGLFVVPPALCASYPVLRFIEKPGWGTAAIVVVSLAIGFLSTFVGSILGTAIYALASQ